MTELERFIVYQEMPVLEDKGKVSHEDAVEHAESEYGKYTEKTKDDLTQVEKDFLETIRRTYQLLEGKKPQGKK